MSGIYSQEAVEAVQQKFSDAVLEVREFRGELTIIIEPEHLIEICTFLRDTGGLEFNHLTDVGGVDYLGYPGHTHDRVGIHYTLYSLTHNHMIRLKVFLPDGKPAIKSVTGVWPAANWMEREIFDMFGITFEDHPDPRRILMPFDWTGYPQRKDYPLGYEEVQFSFNYERVQAKKPHPQE